MWLRLLLTHKNLVVKVFWVVLLLGVVGLSWMAQRHYILTWLTIGSLAAKTAVISYLLTLMPGILKRFELSSLLQPIHLPLMTFRRQVGILSFTAAFYHFLFSFALIRWPKIELILLPREIENLLGWTALHILFVLFITSNDWAIKNLGVWWHKLHNLTHVVIWLLLIHVLLKVGGVYTYLIGATGIINLASFGYKYFRKTNQAVNGVV